MNAIAQVLQQTYTLLDHPVNIVLFLLPVQMAATLLYIKDLFASLVSILGGRILPTLNPTPQPVDLTGKTAIVTGSNSGIGLQIASDLARLNCTVYLACRSPSRARTAVDTITTRTPSARDRVSALSLDTSSLSSVKTFVESWRSTSHRIDILVHNAGIAAPTPADKNFTDDGLEVLYATNLLGSFALTHGLESCLAPDAHVVFTSSTGQYSGQFSARFALESTQGVVEPGFHRPLQKGVAAGVEKTLVQDGSSGRYGNTKAMQVALAKLLQRKWDQEVELRGDGEGARRVVHAFTPGFTFTPIFGKIQTDSWTRDWLFTLLKATTVLATGVDQGAATGVWLATTRDDSVVGRGNGGGYWDRMVRRMSVADRLNEDVLDRLWVRWERDAGIEWR